MNAQKIVDHAIKKGYLVECCGGCGKTYKADYDCGCPAGSSYKWNPNLIFLPTEQARSVVEPEVKPTCVNCFYATTIKNDDVISSICHCQISPICWMQEKEIKYGIPITRMRECDGCNHFKKASSV